MPPTLSPEKSAGCPSVFDPARHTNRRTLFQGELRGSQGMGVVSNSWFDRALLSVLYMSEPLC